MSRRIDWDKAAGYVLLLGYCLAIWAATLFFMGWLFQHARPLFFVIVAAVGIAGIALLGKAKRW